ncbi:MAG: aconitase/3-isopropylmalate dehydratase large subunit family protein [Pseudolabrys sp.]
MGMTIAEKILSRAAGLASTKPGDYLDCALDGLMAQESFIETHNAAIDAGMPDGLPGAWDPDKIFMMIEHYQPASTLRAGLRGVKLREFAKRYKIKNFHDTTCGVCHQMMVDNAYALPGQLIVGTDSHTTMYGALNCASTGIGETDAGYAMSFGELWFRVPSSVRVELVGKAPNWPIGKDVMLHLGGTYGLDFGLYKSVEFTGPGVESLSMDSRFTIADHGVEVGTKFALFECDERTHEYLRKTNAKPYESVKADRDAGYAASYTVNLSNLAPQIAAPHSFGNLKDFREVEGIHIDQACIGSCANGRFEDVEIAAKILKGRKIKSGTRLLVSCASWGEYRKCLDAKLPEIIIDAGGQFLDPGCGICNYSRTYLTPGEVCVTATSRNHQGRMGSKEALIYLANPATVAWSAVRGEIADPREVLCELY